MVMDSGSGQHMNTNINSNTNTAMVNESASFSPQSVGREFVRQYYTMLNSGPHMLHRFYNDDSAFVHGGVDRPGEVSNPVFGRESISKKIQSLNFCDCHAKILQVDSMETIGNGVVVQVTGELSNNGQGMRRFFQTFVLATLAANKYYVRNDIFRYQDEIFVDEDEHSEVDSRVDNMDLDRSAHELEQPLQQQANMNVENSVNVSVAPIESKEIFYENTNGNVNVHAHEEVVSSSSPVINENTKREVKRETTPANENSLIGNEEQQQVSHVEKPSNEFTSSSPIPTQQQQLENSETTKTWANIVNKNPPFLPFGNTFGMGKIETSVSLGGPSYARPSESSPTPGGVPANANTSTAVVGNANATSQAQTTNQAHGKPPTSTASTGSHPQRDQRSNRDRAQRSQFPKRNDSREMTPGRVGSGSNEEVADGSDYNRKQYPDELQVFVGNLPQHIVEDDLRKLFSQYGNIIDVRINRQNQDRTKAGSNKTPNYGFVTFEDPEVVQGILKLKPIYFDNHRFNVEEKRSQSGRGGGGGGQDRDRERGGGAGGQRDRGSFSGSGMGGGAGREGRMNNNYGGNQSGSNRQSGGRERDRDAPRDRDNRENRNDRNRDRTNPTLTSGGGSAGRTNSGAMTGFGGGNRNNNNFNKQQASQSQQQQPR